MSHLVYIYIRLRSRVLTSCLPNGVFVATQAHRYSIQPTDTYWLLYAVTLCNFQAKGMTTAAPRMCICKEPLWCNLE